MTRTTSHPVERFDMYSPVHKALRAFMADTLTAVGRIDPGDDGEIAEGLGQTRALINICRDHLHKENQFIHPAMEARKPGSAWTTTNDHVQHEESFERIEGEILAVERSSDFAERGRALRSLYRSLSIFVADNYHHMVVEETENQTALWEAYTDRELADLHKAILSATPPEKMVVYLKWMIQYMSAPERTQVLTGVRATIPAAAFEQILHLVESWLTAKDWEKVSAGLSLSAVLA